MCVIAFKNIGVDNMSQEIFEQCWSTNPDGFGMAVAYGDHVELQKGFMTLDDAWLAARNIPKECAAVLHFRIGTSGKNDGPTCHPFPISNDPKDLRALRFDRLPYAVVHNGIISSNGEGRLSDTQVWVRDKLSMLYRQELVSLQYHTELVQMFLNESADAYSSRFAVLNADGSCIMSGIWHEHESGLLFSNNNWKYVRPTYNSSYKGKSYTWWYGTDEPKKETAKQSTYDDEYYYDDEYTGYAPTCPYCGSYDTVSLDASQYDLCECYDCGSIFDARTGTEYELVVRQTEEKEAV